MSVYLAALEVWLDPAIINVTEGNEARIRALLNLNSSELVTVDFVTTDGSAMSKYFHAQALLLKMHTPPTHSKCFHNKLPCVMIHTCFLHEMHMALTIWRG